MKHALVTGSSGYVGKVLVRQLLSKGYVVTGIDLISGKSNEQFVEIQCDVRDLEQLKNAMSTADIVFHNAASVPLEMNSSLGNMNNEEMCRAVLDCALESNLEKLIFVSTSAVFGHPDKLPVKESSPLAPFDPYGIAKVRCEQMCLEPKYRNLDITIVRPRTILGENRLGLMTVLFSIVQSGLPIVVPSSRSSRYQLIHVEDLVSGIILAGERKGRGVYNFGADDSESMADLLRAFVVSVQSRSKVIGVNRTAFVGILSMLRFLRLVPFTSYQIQMYGREIWFDTTKAKTDLGWIPTWTGLEMLGQSYEMFINRDTQRVITGSAHSRPLGSKLLNLLIRLSRVLRKTPIN